MRDPKELHLTLEDLSLTPLGPDCPPASKKAEFRVDTRGTGDRRNNPERRQSIRFEEDRRKGERRAHGPAWKRGTII